MELEEALNVIGQVCAAHQGNLADHQLIQKALEVVRDGLFAEADEATTAQKGL